MNGEITAGFWPSLLKVYKVDQTLHEMADITTFFSSCGDGAYRAG